MRITRLGWIGVATIVASLTLLGSWTAWSNSRSWSLVDDVPISLSQGTHYSTGELPVNLSARYEIEIFAENKIDPEKLQCMLGTSFPKRGCDTPVVLKVRWALSSEGRLCRVIPTIQSATVVADLGRWERIASSVTFIVKRGTATNSIFMCFLIRAALT